jgi:hypothetical protein
LEKIEEKYKSIFDTFETQGEILDYYLSKVDGDNEKIAESVAIVA